MKSRLIASCAVAMAAALSSAALATPRPALKPAVATAPAAPPIFTSPALARAWGDKEQAAGRYALAGDAYLQESALYAKRGDAQAAEVERRRAYSMDTTLQIGVAVAPTAPAVGLAKLEPASGCYLGVLDAPGEGHSFAGEANADDFERRIGQVAVAFRYVRYGDPFPFAWAYQEAKKGRAIQIALEPYDIYAVADDEYLEGFAADLNQSGADCFLRFGGEMNGSWAPWGRDPAAYRRAFRTVHDVMAHFAPRCAMVWAPNMVPLDDVNKYYPGDDVVDWVGLSLYLVKYYDDNPKQPGWQDSPEVYIDPFYAKYASRKPMCLAECGVSREEKVNGAPSDAFAAARIEDLLSAIEVRYPRIKMLCWFDRDNLDSVDPDLRQNDFSLPDGTAALQAFKTAVASPYFLSSVDGSQGAPAAFAAAGDDLPPGYAGPMVFSVATYCLNPTLCVTRGGQTTSLSRPFVLATPPAGAGPITVTVKDEQGRVADREVLEARSGASATMAEAAP